LQAKLFLVERDERITLGNGVPQINVHLSNSASNFGPDHRKFVPNQAAVGTNRDRPDLRLNSDDFRLERR
jgi:hypothetical protein